MQYIILPSIAGRGVSVHETCSPPFIWGRLAVVRHGNKAEKLPWATQALRHAVLKILEGSRSADGVFEAWEAL
jgi:hypothetical protein